MSISLTSESSGKDDKQEALNARLVNWMTELLLDSIRKVVYVRGKQGHGEGEMIFRRPPGKTYLAEVKEIIEMPAFEPAAPSSLFEEHRDIVIAPEVVESLREYVAAIAEMYR